MSGANRKRGQRAEVAVVNWLRANGHPDARRYLAGDGRQPGDIDAIAGLCIEVKDRTESAWPTWCRQAQNEADGRWWVVIRRRRGTTNVAAWPCRAGVGDQVVYRCTFGVFLADWLSENVA